MLRVVETSKKGGQAVQRKLGVLTSVTAKRRKSWLLAASALASSSLGVSEPALAACSAIDPITGDATCTAGFYTAPIAYSQTTPNTPLNVTLDPTPPGVNVTLPGPGHAVSLGNFFGGAATLSANNATINVNSPAAAAAASNMGLLVETSSNNATITASGQIDVVGTQGNFAIRAISSISSGSGDASVTYTGAGLTPFDLRSSGTNSVVIHAEAFSGSGNASIDASGNMSSSGQSNDFFTGLFAQAPNGKASVIYPPRRQPPPCPFSRRRR